MRHTRDSFLKIELKLRWKKTYKRKLISGIRTSEIYGLEASNLVVMYFKAPVFDTNQSNRCIAIKCKVKTMLWMILILLPILCGALEIDTTPNVDECVNMSKVIHFDNKLSTIFFSRKRNRPDCAFEFAKWLWKSALTT